MSGHVEVGVIFSIPRDDIHEDWDDRSVADALVDVLKPEFEDTNIELELLSIGSRP